MAAAPPLPDTARPTTTATIALAVLLAGGAFAVAAPVLLLVAHPAVLPPPLPAQHQRAETASYLLLFGVLLPGGLLAAGRLAGRAGSTAVAGILAALLAAALIAVRLSGALGTGDGLHAVIAAAVVWWVAAGALLARPRPGLARHAVAAWAAAAALLLGALLCLSDLSSISPGALIAGLLVAAGAVALYERAPGRRLPRAAGVAADVVLLVLLVLVIPDLLIFRQDQPGGGFNAALEAGIIRFHQNFLLGPANDVLAGGTVLVDTASQYGVGSIYLVAGWSKLLGIGYGTFGALDDGLTALWFACGYTILRMAGVSRALVAAALSIGVVALVFNLSYPVGAIPQDGPLRFGLPMAMLVALVAEDRWPRRAGLARGAALIVAGLSAIFSFEQLAYGTFVYVAVALVRGWLAPPGTRVRRIAREGLQLVAAWVVAHVALAVITLAASGHLPDWGQYLAYLHAFLFGSVGELTYDVPVWSPGLAVGGVCLASAAALLELARRRSPLFAREPVALTALVGLTAYAIALLSYWVDRSLDHVLMHVALPELLLVTLWLSLLLRSRESVARPLRLAGLTFALAVAVLVAATAWSSFGPRFPRTPLAHAAPGGSSLRGALTRLRHPPPFSRGAGLGPGVLARWMPGERRSLVVTAPDAGIEILLRSHRADALVIGDPTETSFVANRQLPSLGRKVDGLRPGRRMLMDQGAVAALRYLRAHPGADPLTTNGLGLAPLQLWALRRIDQRFQLRRVARATGGLEVWALGARR